MVPIGPNVFRQDAPRGVRQPSALRRQRDDEIEDNPQSLVSRDQPRSFLWFQGCIIADQTPAPPLGSVDVGKMPMPPQTHDTSAFRMSR